VKKLIAGAGVAAMLLAGAGVAAAQADDEGGREGGPGPGLVERPHARGFGGLRGFAEGLGLDPAELREELAAGRTIAQIAEQQGVDLEAVIQSMLDETEERLRDLTTRTFDGEVFDGPFGRRGPGRSFDGPPRADAGDDGTTPTSA